MVIAYVLYLSQWTALAYAVVVSGTRWWLEVEAKT